MSDRGAWHGDQALKDRIVELLLEDQRLNRYEQGTYLRPWNRYNQYRETAEQAFRGCHIGCLMMAHKRATQYTREELSNVVSLESMAVAAEAKAADWHYAMPAALGIPEWLAHLWDSTFESVPPQHAAQFAVHSLQALPVGADIRPLRAQLLLWLVHRVDEEAHKTSPTFKAVRRDLIDALREETLAPRDPLVWIGLRDTVAKENPNRQLGLVDNFLLAVIRCMTGGTAAMLAVVDAAAVYAEAHHELPLHSSHGSYEAFFLRFANALVDLTAALLPVAEHTP